MIIKNPENGNCIVVAPHEPFVKEEYTAYYYTEETEENIFKVFPKSRSLLKTIGTRLIIKKADVVEEKIEVLSSDGEPAITGYNVFISNIEPIDTNLLALEIRYDWKN